MDTAPEIINLQPGPAIAIRARVALAELPRFFGGAFAELGACGGDRITGPPLAIYHSFEPAEIDVEAVMPVRAAVPVAGRVQAIDLAGGPAVQIRHIGPYEDLGAAYVLIERWLDDHHHAKAAAIREVYLTAATVPAAERVTLVIQPLQDTGDRVGA